MSMLIIITHDRIKVKLGTSAKWRELPAAACDVSDTRGS